MTSPYDPEENGVSDRSATVTDTVTPGGGGAKMLSDTSIVRLPKKEGKYIMGQNLDRNGRLENEVLRL